MKTQDLTHILRDGETVVWESRPQNIRMMEAPFMRSIWLHMTGAIVLIAAALWFALSAAPAHGVSITTTYVVATILVLLGIYLAIRPMRIVQNLENRTHYYITNQRFIATYASPFSMRVNYRELDDISEMLIDVTGKGRANLFIGPCSKEMFAHGRDLVHNYSPAEKGTTMVFYSIDNAFASCDCLPTHIAISRCTAAVTAFNE